MRWVNHKDSATDGSYVRQSVVYDARYQGKVKIEYPLHPLFGRWGTVSRQVKYGGVPFFDLVVDGKPITVAQWMARPELCQFCTCGFEPVCDWPTLRRLLHLLDAQKM